MKGARRCISVLLLLVTLCTFLPFPAGAIGEGTIPNFANSAWLFGGDNMSLGDSNGSYIFSNKGDAVAVIYFDLAPGDRYRLSGTFGLAGNVTTGKYYIGLGFEGDATELVLIDQTAKGKVSVNREFVVPDNGGQVLMLVSLGVWSALEYSSDWKIENTSTDKGILNSIKEGFSKLWEWLQGIWDSIKEIPTKIGQFITNLGDRISGFFTNLTNSIKGFFTDLWDKIWNGDGSVPPFDADNKFSQVIEKINEWTSTIKGFSESIDDTADSVTGYLNTATTFLNSAMGVFPAALTAVLTFGLVFLVVRKVVGR